jgi:hypothetical protein
MPEPKPEPIYLITTPEIEHLLANNETPLEELLRLEACKRKCSAALTRSPRGRILEGTGNCHSVQRRPGGGSHPHPYPRLEPLVTEASLW